MHDSRLARLSARLEAEQLDALLVTALPNVFYLSGFTGTTAWLLLTPQQHYFLTDYRYHGRFETEVVADFELVDTTQLGTAGTALRLLNALGLRRVAFESEHLTHAQLLALQPDEIELVPTRTWVETLRQIKDADEMDRMRTAVGIGERVFEALLPLICPATTEGDLAAEIEYRARKLGATACSFVPIIASGGRSALPHAGFTNALVQPASPLILDLGVVYRGYCSDMTRTVFLADCPPVWRARYELVREAQSLALAALGPGQRGKEVDAVARDFLREARYEQEFGHGLGHGVGIQIHEDPRLHWTSEQTLVAGNTVTVEPGVYFPGEGGIRIENLALVQSGGGVSLTELGTTLTVVG